MLKGLVYKAVSGLKEEEKRTLYNKLKDELDNKEPSKVEEVPQNEVKTEETESVEEVKDTTENGGGEEVKTEDVETEEENIDVQPQDNEQIEQEQATEEELGAENGGEVQDVEGVANGIRVEDLMTKNEFMEKFAALEAKYDAIVKENTDLKNKYEEKDFGGFKNKGMPKKENVKSQSYDEYIKDFL